MKMNQLSLTDGFSFVETACALCLVSVSAVLISVFSGIFLKASRDFKKECMDETVFFETTEAFISEVSQFEVFPYGKNISLSFSDHSLNLLSEEKKQLFDFSFPEQFVIKKASLLFYKDFISGIEVLIISKGECYKIKSDFSDCFPGKKEFIQ